MRPLFMVFMGTNNARARREHFSLVRAFAFWRRLFDWWPVDGTRVRVCLHTARVRCAQDDKRGQQEDVDTCTRVQSVRERERESESAASSLSAQRMPPTNVVVVDIDAPKSIT